MDLHLGNHVVFERLDVVDPHVIDPYDADSITRIFEEKKELPAILMPGQRALLYTTDRVDVPHGSVGLVCLRSTFARLGLISPPTIVDAGFIGQLTMEVFNGSNFALMIRPGDAIWSVHVLSLERVEPLYEGRYQGQMGVTIPRVLSGHAPVETLL